MTMPRVLVSIDKVVRVTENHGGYEGATCIICGASGWLDNKYGYTFKAKGVMDNKLIHKVSCSMNNYAANKP